MTTVIPQALFRCLIVDDLEFHRIGIQKMVESALEGYPSLCNSVGSGAEAVQLCAQSTYNLIIVDYNMPEMNGAETVRKILALQPNAHIVGCTACEDPETIQKCLDAGMKRVFPKDWRQVREFVKKLIPDALKRTSLG